MACNCMIIIYDVNRMHVDILGAARPSLHEHLLHSSSGHPMTNLDGHNIGELTLKQWDTAKSTAVIELLGETGILRGPVSIWMARMMCSTMIDQERKGISKPIGRYDYS